MGWSRGPCASLDPPVLRSLRVFAEYFVSVFQSSPGDRRRICVAGLVYHTLRWIDPRSPRSARSHLKRIQRAIPFLWLVTPRSFFWSKLMSFSQKVSPRMVSKIVAFSLLSLSLSSVIDQMRGSAGKECTGICWFCKEQFSQWQFLGGREIGLADAPRFFCGVPGVFPRKQAGNDYRKSLLLPLGSFVPLNLFRLRFVYGITKCSTFCF